MIRIDILQIYIKLVNCVFYVIKLYVRPRYICVSNRSLFRTLPYNPYGKLKTKIALPIKGKRRKARKKNLRFKTQMQPWRLSIRNVIKVFQLVLFNQNNHQNIVEFYSFQSIIKHKISRPHFSEIRMQYIYFNLGKFKQNNT